MCNFTIDKFINISVSNLNSNYYKEKYRLNYSNTERVNNLENIKNNRIRETIKFLDYRKPLYISTFAEIPSGTGLGSSSSLVVGLINLINKLDKKRMTKDEIAKIACEIEMKIDKNIGKQDQYAAAYKGFNQFIFKKDGVVEVKSLNNYIDIINKISEKSLLFWTGIQRDSKIILSKQSNSKSFINSMIKIKKINDQFLSEINNFKFNRFIEMFNEAALIKEQSSNAILDQKLKEIKNTLYKQKVVANKVLGAGGGGFFFCVFNSKKDKLNFYKNNPNKCLNYQLFKN